MNNWLQKGIVLQLLSLVLAFILWFMVNEPTLPFSVGRESTTVTGVVVETRYNTNKFQILKITHKVDLMLIGTKEALNHLPTYHVYVDLSAYGSGNHTVPVQVEGLPVNVEARPLPAKIPVSMAEKGSKNINVQLETHGQLPSGYQLLPISYQPTMVQVNGLKQDVDKVSRISAAIDLTNMTRTASRTVKLVAYTNTGMKAKVRLVPDHLKVTIPVEQVGIDVPLSIVVDKPPPVGYSVVSTTVKPASVRLFGPITVLSVFTNYPGVHLDLSKITSNTTLMQKVLVISPVEKVTPTEVEIYVKIIQTPKIR